MSAPQGILITAGKVHVPFKTELLGTLGSDKFAKRAPHLVGILATKKEDARTYAEFTKKACESIGINFELRLVGEAREGMDGEGVGIDVEEAILEANDDDDVDGMMVYYPIYGGRQDQYLQSVVSPYKDVEGLNHQFLFNLYHNVRFINPLTLRPIPASHLPQPLKPSPSDGDSAPSGTVKSILPCTPLAIVKVLEHIGVYNKMLEYGDRARGKVITVINRSEVVGRPLAALLANDGARVLSVDIDSIVEFSKRPSVPAPSSPKDSTTPGPTAAISPTAPAPALSSSKFNPHHIITPLPASTTLEDCLRISDVVISAVPSQKYKVPTRFLKDGAICVSVAAERNFEADVRDRAGIYVPSVGMMTIAMLQRNLLRLCTFKDEAKKLSSAA
ncbi:methylenetetrahydrofolate dehydrogenase [Dioszegia hungarica]|uniref:Methylenetetrahydrofolate dehydrogenase n=1 Tax=Dioszegia hungarica TaxID=4972 RepID=A0AA38HD16_9TREE|nr:methylenetetrahydrofolate dehydrogenase [Dioszegia hungarica]KAI9636671.1 methylenetetrahydrofolate dehydrogenase [Dioszegia hungarica]